LPATDILGSPIQGSSVGLNGSTATPTTFSSSDLAKLLQSSAASGASNALQQIAKSNTGMALPNLVRGNQNPFTYTAQQPIQNARPMDLSALSKLLKQG